MSPVSRQSAPSSTSRSATPMPTSSACVASSGVIAGPTVRSRVPRRTGCDHRPSAAGRSVPSSVAMPTSTTTTRTPACRASALTAAPPARKFATIWAVTSCGHGVTPRAWTPWSAANTATAGAAGTGGGQVPVIPASRTETSSRAPSAPRGLVRVSCRARADLSARAFAGATAARTRSRVCDGTSGPYAQACCAALSGQLVVEPEPVRAVGVHAEPSPARDAGQLAGTAARHEEEELVAAVGAGGGRGVHIDEGTRPARDGPLERLQGDVGTDTGSAVERRRENRRRAPLDPALIPLLHRRHTHGQRGLDGGSRLDRNGVEADDGEGPLGSHARDRSHSPRAPAIGPCAPRLVGRAGRGAVPPAAAAPPNP